MLNSSNFDIEWMVPLLDEKTELKLHTAKYLEQILPYSFDDLMTLGYSILYNKK